MAIRFAAEQSTTSWECQNYLAVSKVSVGLLSPYIVKKSSPYIVKKGVTLYSGKSKKKTPYIVKKLA